MTMRGTLLALAVAVTALTSCSKAQLSNLADTVCRGLENCTVYDEDGDPSNRDWKPPVDRR